MSSAELETVRNILKDIKEFAAKMKQPNRGPFSVMVPDPYAKYAANLYANQNVIVHTNNGSIYQHGVQLMEPVTHIDVKRLNEKIAAMELNLPSYVKKLQVLPPEYRKVYLLGEWNISEEGE